MGQPRIVPGDPADSVLVQLIGERGKEQMPPIASKLVDQPDVAKVVDWIAHMPSADAGAADGAIEDEAADAIADSGETTADESIGDAPALPDQMVADGGIESSGD